MSKRKRIKSINDQDPEQENQIKQNINKYFQNGTSILLSNGSTKLVENLTLYDNVVGLNGISKWITEINKGREQLYKITQDNGDSYVVNGNHILVLKFTNVEGIFWDKGRQAYKIRYIQDLKLHDKRLPCKVNGVLTDRSKKKGYKNAEKFLLDKRKENGYNKGGDVLEISVNEYLKLPTNIKRILYGFKQEVEYYMNDDVDLDPYMLGMWLGDGTTHGASITNIDQEIIDYIYDYARQNNLKVTKIQDCRYYIASPKTGKGHNTFLNLLKQYDVFGNKHIPIDYLMSSRKVRLQVLAGLIDSDGYLEKGKNMYEIAQLSDKLSVGIVKLTRSLGFRVGHVKRKKTCVKKDAPNVSKMYNIILISGRYIADIPCLLKRKQARECRKDVDFLITKITLEKHESADCTGFKIIGDSKFFGPDYTIMHC